MAHRLARQAPPARNAHLRRRWTGLLLCVALLAAGCAPAGAPAAPVTVTAVPTPTPQIAHGFRLPTLDGGEVVLDDLRGRWVILNFWATWCGPCRDEMPYLGEVARRYPEQLVVLGINLREPPAAVAAFVEEMGVTFPVLLQPDDATLLWYSTRGLPLTYVVAPDGAVAFRQYGPLAPATFDTWLAARM